MKTRYCQQIAVLPAKAFGAGVHKKSHTARWLKTPEKNTANLAAFTHEKAVPS